MQSRHQYGANSAGVFSSTNKICIEDPVRGYRNFNRGFKRGFSNAYQPLHTERGDIFLEAGRLAAEYLVSQGLLSASVLYIESSHSTPRNHYGGLTPNAHEGRISALARLGNITPGKRRFPNEYNSNGARGRRRFTSFAGHRSENMRSGSWTDKNESSIIEYYDELNTGNDVDVVAINSHETEKMCNISNYESPPNETIPLKDDSSSTYEKNLPLPEHTEITGNEGETLNCTTSALSDELNKNDCDDATIDLIALFKRDVPTRARSSTRSKVSKTPSPLDTEKEKISDVLPCPLATELPVNVICKNSAGEPSKSSDPDVSTSQIEYISLICPQGQIRNPVNVSFRDESCDLSLPIKGKLEDNHSQGVIPDDENSKHVKCLAAPSHELQTSESLKLHNIIEESCSSEAKRSCSNEKEVLPSSLEICNHDGKQQVVIDLDNGSAKDNKVSDPLERKSENDVLSLNISNNQNCHNLQVTTSHYGLTFSELLTIDLSNCSSLPEGISLQNDIALLHGEEILGVDDPLYMPLDEIPISFLQSWGQPSQEHGKPF